jgi:hypothetical protein
MTSNISDEVLELIQTGSLMMATSLASYVTSIKKSKKTISTQTARDNYCKSVLLLWGFLSMKLEELDDDMFIRVQLTSASILAGALSRKEFEPMYKGAGLKKIIGAKDHQKIVYEVVKWFKNNDTHPSVQSIITTGKHMFALKAFSGKLEERHVEAFYKMGSLIEDDGMVIHVMKSILVDNKMKLNFK